MGKGASGGKGTGTGDQKRRREKGGCGMGDGGGKAWGGGEGATAPGPGGRPGWRVDGSVAAASPRSPGTAPWAGKSKASGTELKYRKDSIKTWRKKLDEAAKKIN